MRRGATPGSHSSQPETQGILRLLGGSSASPSAAGATGRFASFRAQKSRKSAGFRLSVGRVRAKLRTRIHGLSLAKYRAAPPRTRFAPGRTRFQRLRGSASQRRRFCNSSRPTEINPQTQDAGLPTRNSPLQTTERAAGNNVRGWPQTIDCGGHCQAWSQRERAVKPPLRQSRCKNSRLLRLRRRIVPRVM